MGGKQLLITKKRKLMAFAFFAPILIGIVLSAFKASGDIKNVTIIANDQAYHLTTRANFVSEALKEANIEYDNDDMILPPAMATLSSNEVITVKRWSKEVVEREVIIPSNTIVLKNSRLRVGSEVELKAGAPGIKRETIEVETLDGKVIEESTILSQIVIKPVTRKLYVGTKSVGNTSRVINMVATAYTAGAESCWPYVDGKTATMKKAGYGVAAVDPRVISLGTRMYIEGYGFAIASDVGGAIKGNKIDIFMSDVNSARSFGRRHINVYLLD